MKKIILTFKQLPLYVQLILSATAIAVIGGKGLLGFRISGLTWFIPLLISLVYLVPRLGKVTFPWILWVPWGTLLVVWLCYSDYPALQRTTQLLCPLVTGICASTIPATGKLLADFLRFCRYFAVLLGVLCVANSGFNLAGFIPFNPGLAAELMPSILLNVLFAASYSYGYRKDLLLWGALCTLPVYGLFRSGVVIAGMTLPFTFAPLGLLKRSFFIFCAVPVVLGVFYLPTMQHTMFFSGQGELSDLMSEDFNSSGRKAMWQAVEYGIQDKPWLGYGTGACEDFILRLTGSLRYPHNDWLLTEYDYGKLGLIVLGATLLASMLHAWYMATKTRSRHIRILFTTGAYSFVILALFMFSDNILVYASFFGNFQFMILGLAYSAKRNIVGRPLPAKNLNKFSLFARFQQKLFKRPISPRRRPSLSQ